MSKKCAEYATLKIYFASNGKESNLGSPIKHGNTYSHVFPIMHCQDEKFIRKNKY